MSHVGTAPVGVLVAGVRATSALLLPVFMEGAKWAQFSECVSAALSVSVSAEMGWGRACVWKVLFVLG